ncbi:MAG TPA: hypothetical protein VG838_00650 [Opitutaceae bacterium]|nr:hypothetical protein [Opitutaceae bacterium]
MKSEDKIAAIIQNNAFAQLLGQLSNGRVLTDLADKFPLVVEAVKRTGKKGTLTLQLTVKPEGKGDVTSVEVLDEVKLKLPERDRKATTFFVVGERDLSRADPNQTEIQFPQAPAKAAGGS